MSIEELTTVSGIGKARAQFLMAAGVKTIEDLKAMPLDNLASIKTIGIRNAHRIKAALGVEETAAPEPEAPETAVERDEKKLIDEIVHLIDPKTFKVVRKAKSSLGELQDIVSAGMENLKPLGRKKWLKEYVEYKVLAKKLEKNIGKTLEHLEELPRKTIKQVFRQSDELGQQIQELWNKVKRKKFVSLNQELDEFRKLIKSIRQSRKRGD